MYLIVYDAYCSSLKVKFRTREQSEGTMDKLLLLGDTGKMGCGIRRAFSHDYEIVGCSSKDFDASDLKQVSQLIVGEKPTLVINAVALLGIDTCELDPGKALQLNTLLPKRIAELSRDYEFTFAHLSSDAVFGDVSGRVCVESESPNPFNVYGVTKYGGDCFALNLAPKGYVFRLPMLFGESSKGDQFVEKMLARIEGGATQLDVSSDVVGVPSYSHDLAREMRRALKDDMAPGLYHLANSGSSSLNELIQALVDNLDLDATVNAVSHASFPSIGRKNVHTLLGSEKLPALRSWRSAFREYCERLRPQSRPQQTATLVGETSWR
ncbi:MAG: dTDP-4-dehydrorhamnose reductase [Myxococcota bacterium]